jgi:hypothetical protein
MVVMSLHCPSNDYAALQLTVLLLLLFVATVLLMLLLFYRNPQHCH